MKLTPSQQALLVWIDREGHFHDDDKIKLPGLHFCPDWDSLPVCDASPEKSGCTCSSALSQNEGDRK